MNYERALAVCGEVHCYLEVLEEYGSRATRNRASQLAGQQIQELFEIEKSIAVDRVEKAELYVVETLIEGSSATLQLASETYPSLTETVYFVRENGSWKIGAD